MMRKMAAGYCPAKNRNSAKSGINAPINAPNLFAMGVPTKTAALFVSGHRDLGDGDGVTLHLARQRHSGVTSVHLKQRAVLVGYFVNLTIADKDELTAALDTSQGAFTVGHPR